MFRYFFIIFSMQKLLVVASLLFISSCTLWNNEAPTVTPPAPKPVVTPTPTPTTPEAPKNSTVSLNYTLREWSPTGKVLETTLVDVAQANGLYQSGARYQPFQFPLGANAVVPGFERGVMTMKAWERKIIEVLPKDGYGEATKIETIKNYEIAPKFSVTTDRQKFADNITETVTLSALGEQGKNLVVGQTLTGWANMVAKVAKIDGQNVTLNIDNKDNPFYGKTLAVGLTATKDKAKFTVRALTETWVTLEIENGNSPFTGKEFVVGAQATLPKDGWTLTVKAINGDDITIEVPNTHPLAGKTLYFEVDVLSI